VTVVSLWPGLTRTEFTGRAAVSGEGSRPLDVPGEGVLDLAQAESPRFSGRAVVALAADPEVARHRGLAVGTADLAERYGFTDVDGRIPRVSRSRQPPAGSPAAGAVPSGGPPTAADLAGGPW
jgi:hypothetical protein